MPLPGGDHTFEDCNYYDEDIYDDDIYDEDIYGSYSATTWYYLIRERRLDLLSNDGISAKGGGDTCSTSLVNSLRGHPLVSR